MMHSTQGMFNCGNFFFFFADNKLFLFSAGLLAYKVCLYAHLKVYHSYVYMGCFESILLMVEKI